MREGKEGIISKTVSLAFFSREQIKCCLFRFCVCDRQSGGLTIIDGSMVFVMRMSIPLNGGGRHHARNIPKEPPTMTADADTWHIEQQEGQ